MTSKQSSKQANWKHAELKNYELPRKQLIDTERNAQQTKIPAYQTLWHFIMTYFSGRELIQWLKLLNRLLTFSLHKCHDKLEQLGAKGTVDLRLWAAGKEVS